MTMCVLVNACLFLRVRMFVCKWFQCLYVGVLVFVYVFECVCVLCCVYVFALQMDREKSLFNDNEFAFDLLVAQESYE